MKTNYGPRYYKKPRKIIRAGTDTAKALDNINKKRPPYRGIGASSNVNQGIAQMEKAKLIEVKKMKKYKKYPNSDMPWMRESVRRSYGITGKGKKALEDISHTGVWYASKKKK
jgi:hypothetical protein